MSEEKAFCRTDDLAIGYGKTPLMEHIRLGAEKGSILTLIGPNGAGKSTLLKTLAAQLAPQGGAVLLDEKSLADYSGPERARRTGGRSTPRWPSWGPKRWQDGISTASVTASASACCWPARSASSQRFCFWTSLRRFWM